MRMIGHLESEPLARTFSDYLYVQGIKNQIEAEGDGGWSLWIHSEDEVDKARHLLQAYLADPQDPAVKRMAEKARELASEESERESASRKRFFDRDRLFPRAGIMGMGPLTLGLIAVSVLVHFLKAYPPMHGFIEHLFISDPELFSRDLPEVRSGQVWRLLTPIFLHFGILHILFNMLWLNDLGTMIESRLGTTKLALLVLIIGVASNLAQYFAAGPGFGGMSGVVYGLLGFIWMKGKFDPGSGLFLHPSTVMMMLIWLVLGYTSVLPMPIANTVHTVGLAVGVLWGFAAARRA